MITNILITGRVRGGKTTLVERVIEDVPDTHGFITKAVEEDGERVGFEIQTSEGERVTFAHVDFNTPYKVARYHVNLEKLDDALERLESFKEDDILYVDEVGEMQLLSPHFKDLVRQFLDADNSSLITFSRVYEDPFITAMKERDDVYIVEISDEDRDDKRVFVQHLLRKIEKAWGYAQEPERFTFQDATATLRSEHGTRQLERTDKGWRCNCIFFKDRNICSHTIAISALQS